MPKRNKKRRGDRKAKRVDKPRKTPFLPWSGIIKPMSPHEQRMHVFGAIFPPPPWYPGADLIHARLKRHGMMDVASLIKAKQSWRRARHWLFAQHYDGSGFQMATGLRWYVDEYANRMIEHGPHSLPCSFNIIEAFLQYDDSCFLFGLRPEREHLLDLDDYFAWYSLNELPQDPSLLVDAMEEGIVYSYDLVSSNSGYRIIG